MLLFLIATAGLIASATADPICRPPKKCGPDELTCAVTTPAGCPDNECVAHSYDYQGWKLLSCSQCQDLGQRVNLASDWLS